MDFRARDIDAWSTAGHVVNGERERVEKRVEGKEGRDKGRRRWRERGWFAIKRCRRKVGAHGEGSRASIKSANGNK